MAAIKRLGSVLAVSLVVLALTQAGDPDNAVGQPATQTAPPTPEAALERLFTTPQAQADWFAPSFLGQVPIEQVQALVTGLATTLGEYQSIEPSGDGYVVRFARGSVLARIALDDNGRISVLGFDPPQYTDPEAAFRDALTGLEALPGRKSVLVVENGVERAAVEADTPLSVGSAFKLAVLTALRDQIGADDHAWDEVVRLRSEWRSTRDGVLDEWPDNSPLTLQSLAAQMISISDNTATDALMAVVGREAAEQYAGRNRPLLTTREWAILKAPANADLLERYRQGDEAERRSVLKEAASRLVPPAAAGAGGQPASDVGWFFTARELCALIDGVADLPPMAINPGLADPEAWQQIAFKGGSEQGVINATHYLVGEDGTESCVVATWNGDGVNDQQFQGLVQQLIAGLQ